MPVSRKGEAGTSAKSPGRKGLTSPSDPGSSNLIGLRVAVTRPAADDGEDPLMVALRDSGALPRHLPLTRILPPRDPEALRRAVARVTDYDWLILTSPRAVKAVAVAMIQNGQTPESVVGRVRVAAVGPATAGALDALRLSPDLTPDRFVAEGLVEAFRIRGIEEEARILLLRAEEGRALLPAFLEGAGARIDVVAAYRTVADQDVAKRMAEMVVAREFDALTFTAGSAVRSFAAAWGDRGPLPAGIRIVALGPATARELEGCGFPVDRIASPHTIEALASAVVPRDDLDENCS